MVPVETDFTKPLDPTLYVNSVPADSGAIGTLVARNGYPSLNGELEDDGFVAMLDPTLGPSGLVALALKIDDTREGWLKGAPEIEIHSFASLDGSLNASRLQCSGESAPDPYDFNYDGGSYSSSTGFRLLSQAQLEQTNGSPLAFYIMEDDYERCTIWTDADIVEDLSIAATAFGVSYMFNALYHQNCGICGIISVVAGTYTLGHIHKGLSGNDDYVGGVSDYRPLGTESRAILKGRGTNGSITLMYRAP